MPKTYGIVLAGGQSSRMGTDKAMLSVNGQTLVERAIQTLRASNTHAVLISGSRHGGIVDQYTNIGPVGGIVSVLKTLKLCEGDTLIFTPVDTPLITSALLNKLLEYAQEQGQSCYFDDQFLPVCIVVTPRLIEFINTFDGQPISVKRFLSRLKALSYPSHNTKSFTNLNHPCEWQQYYAACSVA